MINIKTAEIINIELNFNRAIQKAKKYYLEGSVFIYPTDTIYGFSANPFNQDAVLRITEIKGRIKDKHFILLVDSIETLLKYVELQSEKHIDFLISIWPNPISVVLKLNYKTKAILGYDTAAFRIPNHRFSLKLLSGLRMPLISTSVNRSGEPQIIESSVIKEEFENKVDAILLTGKKLFFKPSTLISLTESEPHLLRKGRIKFEDLLEKFH